MEGDFILIDSPVGPYSSADDIKAWILELENMAPSPQVDEAITEAKEWLLNVSG